MPDGTVIRARPVSERDPHDTWRDFGLYCDPSWSPSWPADLIDWPDYGVPSHGDRAVEQIINAFEKARSGMHVEIGCIGGLGRTGTVLACMAILAGTPAADAVAWVRSAYSPQAIETAQQERWVASFAESVTRCRSSG